MNNQKIKTATVAACCGVVGRALVDELVSTGASVVGFCRPGDEARAKELTSKYPGKFTVLFGELTTSQSAKELVTQSLEILGGTIDAHYHAVGVYSRSSWNDVSEEEVARLWSSNFTTAWSLGREIFDVMKSQGFGSLMFVSARDTIRSAPAGMGPYLASKAALNMFVQSLASEGVPFGIRVNAVLPTIIDTQVNREAMPDEDPLNWVNPEQLAGVMLDLSQSSRANVSGALIPVQGKMI
ncbi:short-chain dehydrogenase/reductase SDR [Shewanella sediminis HAW-EB3]|uniref:Short-chain dehydrogenase/reductase SDR n=1 Tax=Shewanella sediminis (strain HAW-EB3) TaxID=425104 RepID=A8FTP5_SHESH|nr:SDR family oxidoreductase [Shewanella sediminis]ABV36218.1 short-chain dehydrogenase/reductase SDR [Shewanella sediminis HAW-EB3]